ncbi:hypothetical protein C5E45_33015, partial [Nocardia nova]
MPVIGYATMPIIPSMDGVSANISKMLTAPLQAAGRQAGQAAGQAAADGARAQAAAVEAATEKFEAARDRQAKADKALEVAELRLQELIDSGKAKQSQLVAAEGKVEELRRTATRTARAKERAEKDLKDAQDSTADSSDNAAGALSRLSSAVDGISGKAAGGAKDLAKMGIAAAGIGSAMGLASEAIDNAALNDKLAAQLGATPAMAKEFGDTAAQLYAGAWGDSLADVNDALKNVWQQGLVGADASQAQIKDTTATVLDLAKAFDVDVSGATAAVGTMLKNGLAPNAQAAMDILTRGFQTGADKGQDLLDTMVEYPTLFRALGISGEQAMGLISQAMNAGARNADQVADALKEFQLRAIDGSDTTANAYRTLGLDAEQMTAAMAAGGQSAAQGLDTVLDRLRGMTDPVQRNAAAVGLFGTKAEDLAGALFAMDPTTAVQGLGDVSGAAQKMSDTLNNNAATSLEQVKRSLQTGLTEALGNSAMWLQNNHDVALGLGIALGVLGGALVAAKVAGLGYAVAQGAIAAASGAGTAAITGNTLAMGAYAIASGVIRVATIAWTGVQWLLNAALSANPIGLVVLALAALAAGVVLAWQHSETFRDIVIGAWEGIKTAALWTWDNVLKPIFGWLGDAFKAAWDGAKAAGDGIAAAWQWISDKATAAKDWIVGAWNNVVDFVTGLPGRVRDAASGLWDGIKDSFRSAINWLISAWNNFQLGFDFTIPVINKHVSFTIGTPDLPLLAGGGIAGRTNAGVLYGPGTGTSDSILGVDTTGVPTALVSNGEGVVKESAMEHGGAKVVAALNAGWVPSSAFLHNMLPGYADGTTSVGGKVTRDQFLDQLRGIEGANYVFGGWPGPGKWETDCSGAQAKAANLIAYGDTETGGRFGTGNMADALAARGALPGLGGPDDYSVAWMIGGPA